VEREKQEQREKISRWKVRFTRLQLILHPTNGLTGYIGLSDNGLLSD